MKSQNYKIEPKTIAFFLVLFLVNLFSLSGIEIENIQFYSQHKQDKYLYESFYKEKTDGVFIDIGAHNGIAFSNTYFFEKNLNWTGICIEPIPDVYDMLRKNRSCICIKGCINSDEEFTSFYRIKGYSEMLSGVYNKFDQQHIDRINREVKMYSQQAEMITVKCYDLTSLLLENNITHVDFISLDTEGGEFEILKSINFDIIDIDIIDVENNYKSMSFRNFLIPLGYVLIKEVECDEIYVKSSLLNKNQV